MSNVWRWDMFYHHSQDCISQRSSCYEVLKTIIGVPDRNNVWIMSRDPQMSEAEYQRMLRYAANLGYDVAKVKRVPQRWPAK